MKSVSRIAKNTIVIFISRFIEAGAGFFIMMILCRYLKPALYGDFAFITAIILAFQPIINLELNTILIRDISKYPEKESLLLGSGLLLKFFLFTGFVLGLIIISYSLHFSTGLKTALYIAGAAEILQQLFWIVSSVFIAHEKMEYETFTTLLYRFITVGGICVLALIGMNREVTYLDLALVFCVLLTGHLARLLYGTFIVKKQFHIERLRSGMNMVKQLVRQSWLMGIATFFTGLSLRLDVYIIKAFKGSVEVSMFHLPHMIVLQLQIFSVALVLALFPTFSRLGGEGEPEARFREIREKSMRSLTFIGLIFSLTLILFSDVIIRIMGGSDFINSSPSLRVLAWCVPILFLNYLAANLLISLKWQNLLIVGAGVSLVLNLILDLIWVPRFGALGAAWGTVFAYSCQLLIALFFLSRREGGRLGVVPIVLVPFSIAIFAVLGGAMIHSWDFFSILMRAGLIIVTSGVLFFIQPRDLRQLLVGKIIGKFIPPAAAQ